jgi:hypothetical protein
VGLVVQSQVYKWTLKGLIPYNVTANPGGGTMHFIEIILMSLGLYIFIGFAFAVCFIFKGASSIDESAASTSLGFKALILPGSALLWPILLNKWIRS